MGEENKDCQGFTIVLQVLDIKIFLCVQGHFETPSSRDWGHIPRLLRQWGTLTLGASIFLLVVFSFVVFAVIITESFASCFV